MTPDDTDGHIDHRWWVLVQIKGIITDDDIRLLGPFDDVNKARAAARAYCPPLPLTKIVFQGELIQP